MKQIFLSINKLLIVIVSLLFASFYYMSAPVEASEAYGAFAAKVSYLNSTTTLGIGCNINQASIEFWLVENNSENPINNSISNWSINLRDSVSNPVKIGGRTMTLGQKKSPAICFDPLKNGFQVIVDSSTNYQPIITPTIFPNTADTGALSDMIGNHFRGYVQLDAKSSVLPMVEAVSPDQDAYDTDPNFRIKTNYLPNPYGVTGLSLSKIYVINQASSNVYTNSINTIGGTGTRLLPGPSSLPEGHYFWTFHQEFNGNNTTQKLTPPATEWNFSNIPASGTPDPLSFTIDKSDPTSLINSFAIIGISTSTNTVTLSFTNSVNDTYSGLAYSTIYVENISTGFPVTEYIATRTFPNNTTASSTVFSLSGLIKGNTYRFYTETGDNIGNILTSNYTNNTIPITFSAPVVDFYSASSSKIYTGVGVIYNSAFYAHATTTDSHNNILPITKRGVCWGISPANLATSTIFTTSSCKYTSNLTFDSQNRYFTYFVGSGLMSSTTYYFRMLAQNIEGWGFSPLGATTTKPNPYGDASSTPSLPTVKFEPPASTTPTTLNPSVRIETAGNLVINEYGLCYSVDSTEISAMDPSQLSNPVYLALWSSRCHLAGPLATTTPLPHISKNSKPYTFAGLAPNTPHYFKVFAINSLGAGTATGTATTLNLNYDFRNFNSVTYGISPRVVINDSDFNSIDEVYEKIEVQIAAYDKSYDCCTYPGQRVVDYQVDLDIANNLSVDDTETGTISLDKSSTTPNFISIYFYDVPLGEIKVTSNINEPISPLYPQDISVSTDKQRSVIITLNNPNLLIDDVSGSDTSSSTEIILDPNLSISVDKPLLRVGQDTNINWNMDNTTSSLECKIYGPSTFGSGGVYSFTHNYIVSGVPTSTGSVGSGVLNNTQIFKFECMSVLDNTQVFSTTTRVTVIGLPREI